MRTACARARGPADPDEVWDRYARPGRWHEWSPQVREVRCDSDLLVAGSAGTVRTIGGAQVRFVVLDVDPVARSWSWRVRVGPLGFVLDHRVLPRPDGGSLAEVDIHGLWPLARLYRVPATVALRRLVR